MRTFSGDVQPHVVLEERIAAGQVFAVVADDASEDGGMAQGSVEEQRVGLHHGWRGLERQSDVVWGANDEKAAVRW